MDVKIPLGPRAMYPKKEQSKHPKLDVVSMWVNVGSDDGVQEEGNVKMARARFQRVLRNFPPLDSLHVM